MFDHLRDQLKKYSYVCLITLGALGCDSADDKDSAEAGSEATAGVSAGVERAGGEEAGAESVGSAGVMGAGASAGAEAGEAVYAGESAGDDAGEELAGAESNETPGGGDAGEAAGEEAGDEVIIEVAGEQSEEWMDPEEFGAPGEGIHAFTMVDINGEEVDMRRYRDRVVLVVNVASRCGYTRQYEDLQTLYTTYRERGLVILGFPANNFGGQEPGTEEEIAEFCSANYGVTFPMFSKISVQGSDIHPLYAYLTESSGQEVSWNFNKFLVGADGLYVQQFLSQAEPLGSEIASALDQLLPAE